MGCLLALAVHVGMGHAILANVYVSSSTQAVLPLATTYVLLRNVALPFQLAWQTVQAASVARGDCKTPLKATFVAAVVNVVFDVILVAGLGMGVAGAALATAPADVLTTRIISGDEGLGPKEVAARILDEEGVEGFANGIKERALYWTPAIGIFLACYCSLRQLALGVLDL